jgi:ribosomal protein S18 acetylase RimI-like enzyme
MAIRSDYQRRGIGNYILKEIVRIGRKKQARFMSLECFEPLTQAINMYQKFGFKKTGKKRDLHGSEIFEMTKPLQN